MKKGSMFVVGMVIVIVVMFMFSGVNEEDIEPNNKVSSIGEVKSNVESVQVKNLIPDTNYSCEENIPDNMRILGKPGVLLVLSDKINGYGLITTYGTCRKNKEVGQIASQFECLGGYAVRDRISEEGIIEEDYKVLFDLTFDENNCEPLVLDGMNYLDCEVIDSSCSWEYCDDWSCGVG